MFISFFTGKVMLFYGISLIMKEKSNASALDVKYGCRYVVLMYWRDQWFFERCGSFKSSRCIALSIK